MVETLIWTKPFQYKFLPENKNSSLLPTCVHATHKLSYKYLLSHSRFLTDFHAYQWTTWFLQKCKLTVTTKDFGIDICTCLRHLSSFQLHAVRWVN